MSGPSRFSALLRGEYKWRCSKISVAALSAFVFANVVAGAAILVSHLSHEDLVLVHAPVLNFANLVLIASVAAAYVFVSLREVRSSQLHLHGLTLFLMMEGQLAYNAKERMTLDALKLRPVLLLTLIVNYVFWWCGKVLLVLLMMQKIRVLGPSAGALWGRTMLVSTLLCGAASVGLPTTSFSLFIIHDIGYPEVFKALTFKVADLPVVANGVLWVIAFTFISAGGIMVIAGFGMLYSASRATYHAFLRLAGRAVDRMQLATVRRKLSQHLLGMFISVVSTLLVLGLAHFADTVDFLGEEEEEDILGGLMITLDVLGDTAGIMLLSGIGVLLIREDPDAGDVSGHIRGLLHSAVLTSRADTVFEGRVVATQSRRCIVSFPGKYLADWNALTWACEQGDLSSACVFLPTSDPKGRFGGHVAQVDVPNVCWCTAMYGEVKPWGCVWFHEWKANVQRAVDLGLELVVVFFPNEAGCGTVAWDDLGSSNLWDGVGLGGSQKVEVAWMRKCGFSVTEEDLGAFRRHMKSR